MSEEKSVEALRAELELHKAELKKLHDQLNPPKSEPFVMQRRDPTEGMGMDRETMREMVRATAGVMADLRADARRPNPIQASQSPIPSTPSAQSQRQRQGWVEPRPLGPPPGVELADRLVDAQDAIDKVELAQRIAKAELAKRSGE